MTGSSLLALIDDIGTLLDDVAALTKVAAQKTAGVLGDDLALNAEQVAGVRADRELPVVWAVAKGSFRNKCILVPVALLLSALLPWLVTPLLMLGGAYLCFEGAEKLLHRFLHGKAEDLAHNNEILDVLLDPGADLVAFEQEKIQGAIRTDFVLSAEIIVIALGTVKDALFVHQVAVVTAIALVMTVGVYGFVAAIVKLDDMGLYLLRDTATGTWHNTRRAVGRGLLLLAPRLMRSLAVIGTLAMFLVGGGILLHGIPQSHAVTHHLAEVLGSAPVVGGLLAALAPSLAGVASGLLAGLLVAGLVALWGWLRRGNTGA